MSVDLLKKAEIVAAAADFIEEFGVSALTMRALGKAMGADPSVVYRHFADKDALLVAIGSALVAEVDLTEAFGGPTPRERLRLAVMELRRIMLARPASGLILTTSGNNPSGHTVELVQWGVAQLRELGLSGNDLVVGYQALEGFVFGLTTYDISSQPDPLEIRRQWFRAAEIPEFDDVSRDTAHIAAINAATFELGLCAILDKLEAMGKP
jgi:AcrR family transcriptional regulator